MDNYVPPVIEPPKTVIGIGGREIGVLGATAFVVLLIIIMPAPMLVKVGFGVLLGGFGVALAFGREPKSGKTAEAYIAQILHFYKRSRFHQRGAVAMDIPAQKTFIPAPAFVAPDPEPTLEPGSGDRKPLFTMPPLPLNVGMFFSIFSLAFLATLLTWLWLGGYQELSLYIKPLF
ncbi:MAG: hypothetical protein ACYDH2_03450 [Anaerolineaceae bacterium]